MMIDFELQASTDGLDILLNVDDIWARNSTTRLSVDASKQCLCHSINSICILNI